MIIDFHTHIFPKKIRTNREDFFSSEPSFELLYKSPKSKLVGIQEIITSMEEHHVDISVIFGFPWKNPETVRINNDYIIRAVGEYPERFIGFCCIDPYQKNAYSEVVRCLDSGLSGVGELAFYRSGIDKEAIEKLRPIMTLCKKQDVPVLIHTNEPVGHIYPGKAPITMKQIYQLAKEFPENKIVLAHWGGGIFFFTLLKKEVKDAMKNIYFDTAASPFLYDTEIYPLALRLAGSEKILFGSDFPLINPSRYYSEMEQAGLAKADVENILGGNAEKLLFKKNQIPC